MTTNSPETGPLAQLVDAYAAADAEVKAAQDRLKDTRDQLMAAYPVLESLEQPTELRGARSVVRVSPREGSWRIDSTRLKAEHPEIYAGYAKRSAPSTVLTVVSL